MNRTNNSPRFHHRLHLLILRRLVIFANIMGISTYVFLRIIFYDLPFVLLEESLILLKIIGLSSAIAIGVSFLILTGHALTYFIRNRRQFKLPGIVHIAEPSVNQNRTA